MATTVKRFVLDDVTPFDVARAAGYTGTKEQYAALLASIATVQSDAATSASNAASSATAAQLAAVAAQHGLDPERDTWLQTFMSNIADMVYDQLESVDGEAY